MVARPDFESRTKARTAREILDWRIQTLNSRGFRIPEPARVFAQIELHRGDNTECRKCHQFWPTSLMDAKPEPLDKSPDPDFTYYLCPPCYGPDWNTQ